MPQLIIDKKKWCKIHRVVLRVLPSTASKVFTIFRKEVEIDLGSSTATATSTITAAPAHGGRVTLSLSSAPSWATLSGSTVTFAPSDAGLYTATVTATEEFMSGDVAGHSTPATETAEAIITVTVTKTVPSNPGGGSEAAQEVKRTVLKKKLLQIIDSRYATMPTIDEIKAEVSQQVRDTLNDGAAKNAIASKIAGLLGVSALGDTTTHTLDHKTPIQQQKNQGQFPFLKGDILFFGSGRR